MNTPRRQHGRREGVSLFAVTTVPASLAFFRGQVEYLRQRRVFMEAVSSPGASLNAFAQAEKVAVHGIPMTRRISPFRDLIALLRLWHCLRTRRPEIVHSHTPKGGLLGMIAAWLARAPVRIYHLRGMPMTAKSGLTRVIMTWTEKIACRLSHRVLCISHSLRQLAVDEGICPADKIKVLAHGSGQGVDAAGRFNPQRVGRDAGLRTRRAYGIPDDAPVLGFVGRIVRDKGIVELAEAWRHLRMEFPSLHLMACGPFEPQDPIPPDVRQRLLDDPRVHFCGMVNDTPPLYATMDVLAFPTYREGFGNVSIEAAAMEVPVVTTQIPGCVDAVVDGVTGTLVPARDAEALTRAISRYLNNPELRRQHGRAGRERALRDFRPEDVWEAIYREYVRLLREKGLPVPEPCPASFVTKTAA